MHILVIPSEQYLAPEAPLAGIFQRDQVRALTRAGVRVGVIAPKPRSLRMLRHGFDLRGQRFHSTEDEGAVVHRFGDWLWIPERTPYLFGKAFERIGQFLYDCYVAQKGMPDLLHAHNALYAGSFALTLKRKTGLPVVLTEHSSVHLRGTLRGWQQRIVRGVFEQVDARIAVSPVLCRALEARYPASNGEWRWIPNVLDPIFEDQVPCLPPAGESFRFLTVGMLKPVKNHVGLITAFAEAFGDSGTAELRIVGSGPLRDTLIDLARSLGVSDRVCFLGQLDRQGILEEMRNCNVFVLSSTNETFGVVLIEALACGRPVIATACGGPEEIVQESNGLLVTPSSPDALRSGLVRIRETIEQYDPMGIRARCLARFGREVIARQLLALYRGLLG